MKISRQEDYAIALVSALLEENRSGRYLKLAFIAKKYRLPLAFLRKIAATLKTAGVVAVKEGRNGGYRLAGAARSLTLGQVLGAFSPSLFLTHCISADHSRRCSVYSRCPGRLAWQKVSRRLTNDLYKIKFQEFIKQTPV